MARLEEDLPDDPPKAKELEIESTKMGLMGPLAAIGDSLFWSGLKPFSMLMGVGIIWLTKFTLNGWIWAVAVSLIIYNAPRVIIKSYLLFKAYYRYRELFSSIQKVYRRIFPWKGTDAGGAQMARYSGALRGVYGGGMGAALKKAHFLYFYDNGGCMHSAGLYNITGRERQNAI